MIASVELMKEKKILFLMEPVNYDSTVYIMGSIITAKSQLFKDGFYFIHSLLTTNPQEFPTISSIRNSIT